MTAAPRLAFLLLIGVIGFIPAHGGAAVCGTGSADAAMLENTWTAMDAACPCAAATDHRAYARCANGVVTQRHHDGLLSSACRSVARKRATQSTCGRPGSAVCCRTAGTRVRGRIVRSAARCKATGHTSACVADPTNVVEGCTATGCVACGNGVVDPGEECEAPTPNCVACRFQPCGNGVIDPGEECDPPGGTCLPDCRFSKCGDGVVEGPEQCEPTGAPGCTDDCRTGSCAAPPSGETAVACVTGSSAVAVAAGPGGALVAWDSVRSLQAINGRRLDASGVPIEPVSFEVSEPVATAGPVAQTGPQIGGDASGWYVDWYGSGPLPVYRVGGARVDATGAVTSHQLLAQVATFGMCSSGIQAPIGVVAEQPDQVATVWGNVEGCFNGPIVNWHSGIRLTFSGGQVQSTTGVGIEPSGFPQPAVASDPLGGLASGGGDTVATFVSALYDWSSGPPVLTDSGLFAWWFPPTPGRMKLSSAPSNASSGPGVAWGSSSFLVAWAQPGMGGSDVRAVRFTRTGGPLDPDGGLVLATGTAVAGALRVAFDGTAWLVVWSVQTAPGLYDVRGVAVHPDGTIVDASPRLLASGVGGFGSFSITPWSGGWLLGIVRAAGSNLVSVNVAPIAD